MTRSVLSVLVMVLAALLLVLAVAMPAGASASSMCKNADTMPDTISPNATHRSVLCLINHTRRSHRLGRLHQNKRLRSSALLHSREMLEHGYFAHESPDGSSFLDRIASTGYLARASMWTVGENIAWGSSTMSTPRALVSAWMNSREHRHNILSPRFRSIGLGAVPGEPFDPEVTDAVTITTDFGFRHRW